MFFMVRYKNTTIAKKVSSEKIRSFEVLKRFLSGANITKINPAKLLIKNRGYLEILFQKSFIK